MSTTILVSPVIVKNALEQSADIYRDLHREFLETQNINSLHVAAIAEAFSLLSNDAFAVEFLTSRLYLSRS